MNLSERSRLLMVALKAGVDDCIAAMNEHDGPDNQRNYEPMRPELEAWREKLFPHV